MKYAWIQDHRDSYPVAVMCRALQVSTSGFYRSRKAQPGPRAQRSARIRECVAAVFESSNQGYGSTKIARTLETASSLETACRNTVAKAMREMGLKSRVSAKFKPTTTQTDPSKQPAPNLLAPARTAVHRDGPEPKVGRRYHLPADCGRLGLTRRRSRSVQPQGRGLGHLRESGDSRRLAAPCGRRSNRAARNQANCCTTAIAAVSTRVKTINRLFALWGSAVR